MDRKKKINKIKEFFRRIFRKNKQCPGNFRFEKKQSEYARNFAEQPRVWIVEPLSSKAFRFVSGTMDYYLSEKYQLQAANLGVSLIRDIFTPDVLPVVASGRLLSDFEVMSLLNDEIFQLLCKYGGMDIAYRYSKYAKEVTRDVGLGKKFFLTRCRYGIPLKMFLLWYKGGVEMPAEIMTEWSGVPERELRNCYRAIIHCFRQTLKEKHRSEIAKNNYASKSKKIEDPDVIYV